MEGFWPYRSLAQRGSAQRRTLKSIYRTLAGSPTNSRWAIGGPSGQSAAPSSLILLSLLFSLIFSIAISIALPLAAVSVLPKSRAGNSTFKFWEVSSPRAGLWAPNKGVCWTQKNAQKRTIFRYLRSLMSLTVCVATWEGIHPFSIVQLDFFCPKKLHPLPTGSNYKESARADRQLAWKWHVNDPQKLLVIEHATKKGGFNSARKLCLASLRVDLNETLASIDEQQTWSPRWKDPRTGMNGALFDRVRSRTWFKIGGNQETQWQLMSYIEKKITSALTPIRSWCVVTQQNVSFFSERDDYSLVRIGFPLPQRNLVYHSEGLGRRQHDTTRILVPH